MKKKADKTKEQKLEDMDFFSLLQATGFVKKEHSNDLKTTTTALVKSQGVSGGGGTLPSIRVQDS